MSAAADHVFEEVGEAGQLVWIAPAADSNIHSRTRLVRLRVMHQQHLQPIVQHQVAVRAIVTGRLGRDEHGRGSGGDGGGGG